MPLLDIRQTRKVTAICSLEESTALQVDQYAAFVKCLPDEVVNKALEYTFGKDSEFQKFRTSTPKGSRPTPHQEGCRGEGGCAARAEGNRSGRSWLKAFLRVCAHSQEVTQASRNSNDSRNDNYSSNSKDNSDVLRTWRILTLHPS